MRRLGLAGLALVGLAIAEIAVVVLVVGQIGLGWTLLALLTTSLLGSWLLRREGVRAWRRFRAAAESGRPPGVEATRGLVGLLSGLLLVLPGFLTDLAGLALLVPPARAAAVRWGQRSVERRLSPSAAGDLFGPRRVRVKPGPPTDRETPPVVEGEIVE